MEYFITKSRSSQNSSNSDDTSKNHQINSATETVNCQLQDLRLNQNDADQGIIKESSVGETTQDSTLIQDSSVNNDIDMVKYAVYENELQMPDIMKLIQKDLSEPYSIYTYRYFIHNWPHLCYMVRDVLIFIRQGCWNLRKSRGARPKVGGKRHES